METLTRYCVFCGKEIPVVSGRKGQGPRASCCPSCNTIDIYQYFRPGERARLRIEAREGRHRERGEPAQPACAPSELPPIDGGKACKEDFPADAGIDLATMLPFRLGAAVRRESDDVEPLQPGGMASPEAEASSDVRMPPEAVRGAETPEEDVYGTVALPASGTEDDYVTMQLKRPFAARFVLVAGKAEPGEMCLQEGANVVGGAKTCDVVIVTPELTVSRRHAVLRCVRVESGQTEVYVEDLNSRNGTQVNGQKITTGTRLVPGDKVTFADVTYRFES